jgi:hypothetical protein
MKAFFFLYIVALFSLLMGSCKKEADPIQASKRDLISRPWKVEQILVDNLPSDTDYSNYEFNFQKDGSYTLTTAAGIGQGTWELSSNGQQIILDKGKLNEDVGTILLLHSEKMHLEFTQMDPKTGNKQLLFKLKA